MNVLKNLFSESIPSVKYIHGNHFLCWIISMYNFGYKCKENNFLFSEDPIYSPMFQIGILFLFCSMSFLFYFLNGNKRIDK